MLFNEDCFCCLVTLHSTAYESKHARNKPAEVELCLLFVKRLKYRSSKQIKKTVLQTTSALVSK